MNVAATVGINIVTFLRPEQWPAFKSIIDTVIREKRVKKYILVVSAEDESSYDISIFSKMYKEKLIVIDGSELTQAKLFGAAFDELRKHPTDYVAILDDESMPEENWINNFLDNLKFFKPEERGKIIMIGNTVDIFNREQSYYSTSDRKKFRDGTLFDILSIRKLATILKHFLRLGSPSHHLPVFRTSAYIGGGVLIPFLAIKNGDTPDESLVMFGVDTEYAWKLGERSYSFFACSQPVFRKPSSDNKKENHVFGIFNPLTKDTDVYYHVRNAVYISRKHTYQNSLTLFLNIAARTTVVCLMGLIQAPTFTLMFKRITLLLKASWDGYTKSVSDR